MAPIKSMCFTHVMLFVSPLKGTCRHVMTSSFEALHLLVCFMEQFLIKPTACKSTEVSWHFSHLLPLSGSAHFSYEETYLFAGRLERWLL